MPINDQKGLDYTTVENNKKAEKADLITLPEDVKGTNCFNCKFVKILEEKQDYGFCQHKEVQLNVTSHMCCKFWDNKNAKRSWEK